MSWNDDFVALEDMARLKISEIHTAMPGRVISFDASTCRAAVKPTLIYHAADGDTLEYPVITGVPVFMPHAGTAQITYPVKAGDDCLIVFCERSLDEWIGKGGEGFHDPRQFDLTDGFAFVGMRPAQEISAENVELINGGTKVSVTPSNTVNIIGDVNIRGTVTASGDVIGGGISLIGHTHGYHHGETSPSH